MGTFKTLAYGCFAFCSGIPQKAAAQENISIEFADQATSARLLHEKQLQAEASFFYTRFTGEENVTCMNQLVNVRYGMTRRIEMGIALEEGKNRDQFVDKTSQGNYPLALTSKISVLQTKDSYASVVFHLGLPFTARKADQLGYWPPMMLAALEHKITEDISVIVNAGIRQAPFGKAISFPLNAGVETHVTESLILIADYYSQINPGQGWQHNVSVAAEYLFSRELGGFISAGQTLNNLDENYFLASGIAFRISQ